MTDPARWTMPEMMRLAAEGAGKVDLGGKRGATKVSLAEIEAMAGALAHLGLRVIHPPMLDGPASGRSGAAPLRPMRVPGDG